MKEKNFATQWFYDIYCWRDKTLYQRIKSIWSDNIGPTNETFTRKDCLTDD